MDSDRETAADTLREARQLLEDLIRAETIHGATPKLAETRRTFEAEIETLEEALKDWDDHAVAPVGVPTSLGSSSRRFVRMG